MTEKQYKILFNLGINTSCNDCGNRHMCPDRRTGDYVLYWVELYTEGKRHRELSIQKKTGKEVIKLQEKYETCERYKEEAVVRLAPTPLSDAGEIRSELDCFQGKMKEVVQAIALERTKVSLEVYGIRNVLMIDLMHCFDTRQMLTYLRTLIYDFAEAIWKGESGIDILDRILAQLESWQWIYENREDVFKWTEEYIRLIKIGMERCELQQQGADLLLEGLHRHLREKRKADDFVAFLLAGSEDVEWNGERFKECASILCWLLKYYKSSRGGFEEKAERIMEILQPYVKEEFDIKQIKGLEKFDMENTKGYNVKLLASYFDNKLKFADVMFRLIA